MSAAVIAITSELDRAKDEVRVLRRALSLTGQAFGDIAKGLDAAVVPMGHRVSNAAATARMSAEYVATVLAEGPQG